jgi:hypothetical protein
MEYMHKTLTVWPHASHYDRSYAFKAGWSDTLWLLGREIELVKGTEIVIATLHAPHAVRRDGMLRNDAGQPQHPGVEISFDTPAGADPQAIRGRQLVRQFGDYKTALRKTHPDTRDPAAGLTDTDYIAVIKSQEKGRAVFATDAYGTWQMNVRAIAKTLEALRAADRYGATQGRQYAGFAGALTAKAGS